MTENDTSPAPTPATALARLTDESAIRDLVARFGLATTRNDAATFRTLWAEGSAWVIGEPYPQRAEGIDDILAMLTRFWEGNDYFMQFTTQGPISIDGDVATSESICQEFGRGPDRHYRTSGIWTDHFRRTSAGWRFTERAWQFLWVDFSPFSGDIYPVTA